ncbi:MAG: VOC family protein [Candidatus Thorarchaeota archaeon]
MENFKIDFGNLKIDQLGFVFKDIEKQADLMQKILGLPKFIFTEPLTHTIRYRGKESQLTSQIAISRLGNTQIELIKWIDGECSYKEFLEQGKEGFHHIASYVENTDPFIEEFKKSGIGILQTGHVLNVRFTYMDTEEKIGCILELLEQISRRKKK